MSTTLNAASAIFNTASFDSTKARIAQEFLSLYNERETAGKSDSELAVAVRKELDTIALSATYDKGMLHTFNTVADLLDNGTFSTIVDTRKNEQKLKTLDDKTLLSNIIKDVNGIKALTKLYGVSLTAKASKV